MVSVHILDQAAAAALRADWLTYEEVGQTAGRLPHGYRAFSRSATLPTAVDLATATRDLLTWQVHQRAGLDIAASSMQVRPDAVAVLSIGIGRLTLRAPCRVVYVVDDPHRRGFAYGTLPGHPECGEEAFILEQHDNGAVTFTITAFSRPASTLAKLAGPVGRRIQDTVTNRYLRALAG